MEKKRLNLLISMALLITAMVIIHLIYSGIHSNNLANEVTFADGLKIVDGVVGTGETANSGMIVSVNYIGKLSNGTKFDSSYDHGEPFSFLLGSGSVIRGWEEGLVGMRVGGKRTLIIPPELGYGGQNVGNGLIPPNSTLVFEIELLQVRASN